MPTPERSADEPPEDASPDSSGSLARSEAYRRRLLDGLLTSIEQRGLGNSTVADIVRHARTSRRTFYEHFTDRSDCFQALVQRHGQITWDGVHAAVDQTAPGPEQVRTAIATMCGSFADHAALTVSSIRELASLGPQARDLQRRLRDTVADALVAIADRAPSAADGRTPEQRMLLARMAVGGMLEIVAVTLDGGGDLREHTDEIADAALRVLDLRA